MSYAMENRRGEMPRGDLSEGGSGGNVRREYVQGEMSYTRRYTSVIRRVSAFTTICLYRTLHQTIETAAEGSRVHDHTSP